ncbi:MAG: lipoprotein signal peptidase [Gammaproteobacteria bacterium]|nr:lipoprotein signal peptidase [Gammaproteobacteria bacterium]
MWTRFLPALVVIALDQASKWLAVAKLELHQPVAVMPSFNFMLAYNEGAAFSFLSEAGGWQRWFFSALALAVSIFLIFWLRRLPATEKWTIVALSLILGGALGNLIDRLAYGYVVDFIQWYYDRFYWPAFNIADSAITVGAVILLASSFFYKEEAVAKESK